MRGPCGKLQGAAGTIQAQEDSLLHLLVFPFRGQLGGKIAAKTRPQGGNGLSRIYPGDGRA